MDEDRGSLSMIHDRMSLGASGTGRTHDTLYIQDDLFDLLSETEVVQQRYASPFYPETFHVDRQRGLLVRHVTTLDGTEIESTVPLIEDVQPTDDLQAAFDKAWLRCREKPGNEVVRGTVRIVDLFCGCGALTLGVAEACRALGLRAEPVLAVDTNAKALATYARNFPEASTSVESVEHLLDSDVGQLPSENEERLRQRLGHVHILLGGPPCQGNSNLNNHTRRDDPKNALFLKMARFAEVVRPDHVIIENVPGVIHDKDGVVARTRSVLEGLGYRVDAMVLRAAELGVAQRRRRHIVVASRERKISLPVLAASYRTEERPIEWACRDLLDAKSADVFDSAAVHSQRNKERIDYLFDNDLYELPNEQRPDCHRLKPHSYSAVYGRMRWDTPAPTITSGFGSTGQGRFVHPERRRTLTPHEAARLQFIPDFFNFGGASRVPLQEMVGNAVPPKLAYVIALELLR